jgi:hypothetical protein
MENSSIQKWEIIVFSLICLLGLFVGGSLYFSPGTFIKDVDFSSAAVRTLVYMWAARQVSIAIAIGYSVFKKSVPMLQISLAAYCLITLQDVFIGVWRRDHGLIVGSSLFCALSAFLIWNLTRRSARSRPHA